MHHCDTYLEVQKSKDQDLCSEGKVRVDEQGSEDCGKGGDTSFVGQVSVRRCLQCVSL